MAIERLPRKQSATDMQVPAANTAAVITYAAQTDVRHIISAIFWSYSAAPTGGRLTIQDGAGTTVFDMDITGAGPGAVYFDEPLMGSSNTALIITLAAGSGTVVGKVNARHGTF